jgi:hypothetical protein
MSSKVFHDKIIGGPTKIGNGNIIKKTVQIYKDKGERITEKEIEAIVSSIEQSAIKKKEKIKIAVYGLNGDRIRNLKSYDGELHIQTYDDYHQGIDFESPNFMDFYQLEISINKYIN